MALRAYISNLDKDSFMLFGTLKDNLDPDGLHETEILIRALKHFDLVGTIIRCIGSTYIEDIYAFFEGDYKPTIDNEDDLKLKKKNKINNNNDDDNDDDEDSDKSYDENDFRRAK